MIKPSERASLKPENLGKSVAFGRAQPVPREVNPDFPSREFRVCTVLDGLSCKDGLRRKFSAC